MLKEPENSPLAVWEQVAISYAGLNGYLDEVAVEKVHEFTMGLRNYIKTSKTKFTEIIGAEKKLTDEAESLLKEAIGEYKQAFAV